PIGCEQVVGLARLIRGNCQAAFENVALWHERDSSHSSVERVILPDSFIALDHMLRRFTRIVRGMVVAAYRMRANLNRSRGRVFLTLMPSVFDPTGKTIDDALHSLGYGGIEDVRQGKYFELDLATKEAAQAKKLAAEVADKLLANPVIESYRIEVE